MGQDACDPDEVPDGMILVGWACQSHRHGCLFSFSDVGGRQDDGARLAPNHHGTCVPVFARIDDLNEEQVAMYTELATVPYKPEDDGW